MTTDNDTSADIPLLRVKPHIDDERRFVFVTSSGEHIRLGGHDAAQLAVDILNVTAPRGAPGILQQPRERVLPIHVLDDAPDPRDPVIRYSDRDPWGSRNVEIHTGRQFFNHGYQSAQRAIRSALGAKADDY